MRGIESVKQRRGQLTHAAVALVQQSEEVEFLVLCEVGQPSRLDERFHWAGQSGAPSLRPHIGLVDPGRGSLGARCQGWRQPLDHFRKVPGRQPA